MSFASPLPPLPPLIVVSVDFFFSSNVVIANKSPCTFRFDSNILIWIILLSISGGNTTKKILNPNRICHDVNGWILKTHTSETSSSYSCNRRNWRNELPTTTLLTTCVMELTILMDFFLLSLSLSNVTHSTCQTTHTTHCSHGFTIIYHSCGHEIFERKWQLKKKLLKIFSLWLSEPDTSAARFRSDFRWKVYTIILSWPVLSADKATTGVWYAPYFVFIVRDSRSTRPKVFIWSTIKQ